MWALHTIDVLAIVAFAFSGAWRAKEKQMDILGAVILGIICAFGGGWIRDVLLDRGIPLSLKLSYDLPLATGVAVIAFLFFKKTPEKLNHAIGVLDALGLGLYSASATQMGLDLSLPVFSVCMLAVVAGAGGGVLRDLIVNEIPFILRREELYATCAVTGSLVMQGMHQMGFSSEKNLLVGILITSLFRLLTIRYKWCLNLGFRSTHSP